MQLLSLDNVFLAYGLHPLLDHVNFQIYSGERVCLIGRNGVGKSCLLKVIEGSLHPDSGRVIRAPHLRIARLEQELRPDSSNTVYDYVSTGLEDIGQLLASYFKITLELNQIHDSHYSEKLATLEKLQNKIDAKDAWRYEQLLSSTLTKLELNPNQKLSDLSGGWLRRAALAKALVSSPDLLLLDEPTNHLDLEAIQWLEEELLNTKVSLLFITHDRTFLQKLATRIIELDRGQLTSWPGDYENFLRRKEESLNAESKQNEVFDKKLAQEEKWIRQGIKARRTRNEGRVRALEAMRAERRQRREVEGKANFAIQMADKSGHLVVEAKEVTHSFDDIKIIDSFSIRIMRGDRVGLIGPNGVGKTTLLNLLLGQLQPQFGTIKLGSKLEVAYFGQLRQGIDLEKTVIENVGHGSDYIEINGLKKHVIGYLNDFLFTPERARTPVKALSGGECNRLLLARLFSQPANLLVLDEPTNDLDIETLELLEELLAEFPGTLLIVSHDRTFLNNVVTSNLVFEGQGKITEYIGPYQEKQNQPKQNQDKKTSITSHLTESDNSEENEKEPTKKKSPKLSNREQRDLNELPQKIEKLELQHKDLREKISQPDFYRGSPNDIAATLNLLKQVEKDIQDAYSRWEELDNR